MKCFLGFHKWVTRDWEVEPGVMAWRVECRRCGQDSWRRDRQDHSCVRTSRTGSEVGHEEARMSDPEKVVERLEGAARAAYLDSRSDAIPLMEAAALIRDFVRERDALREAAERLVNHKGIWQAKWVSEPPAWANLRAALKARERAQKLDMRRRG